PPTPAEGRTRSRRRRGGRAPRRRRGRRTPEDARHGWSSFGFETSAPPSVLFGRFRAPDRTYGEPSARGARAGPKIRQISGFGVQTKSRRAPFSPGRARRAAPRTGRGSG